MLGWPRERVRIVDADLGHSGAQTGEREGFKQLVADVALGEVGLVLVIEVSRLARDNAAWYQLLDLCALTGTLIADADDLYDPADYSDRLVLGLKGTISEALCRTRHRASYGNPAVMPSTRRKAAWAGVSGGHGVGIILDLD